MSSMHDIETRLAELQREVRHLNIAIDNMSAERVAAGLPRSADDGWRVATTDFYHHLYGHMVERPTEPELAPPTIAEPARRSIAKVPAITALAAYATRLLAARLHDPDLPVSAVSENLLGLDLNDLAATIEAAKREDAELQLLRRIAAAAGEYFVEEAVLIEGSWSGVTTLDARKHLLRTATKNDLVALLQAWRSPRRST